MCGVDTVTEVNSGYTNTKNLETVLMVGISVVQQLY